MAAHSTKELAQALLELTESPEAGENVVKEFAAYLAKKGMLSKGKEIMEEYSKLYNEKHNILEATVTLLSRLPEATRLELREALKKKYGAKEVHMLEKVDQRILGGMKVRIKDEVFDSTVENSLKQLQAQLLK